MDDRNEVIELLSSAYILSHPDQALRELERLHSAQGANLICSLPTHVSVRALNGLRPESASLLFAKIPDETLKTLLVKMNFHRLAAFVARMSDEEKHRILSHLPLQEAKEIQEYCVYASDRAGFFMDTRFITLHPEDTVEFALSRIRKVKDREVVEIYVIDSEMRLKGKIPIQRLAVEDPDKYLSKLTSSNPLRISALAPKEDVVELMEKYRVASLPVTDGEDRLVGVIRYHALVSILQQDAASDLQMMVGAGKEERALSPINYAIRKRLPWLSINLLTTFLAASVVSLFEDMIAKVTALAVLLPVVAGQSGNTGAQAQAVTLRGLALREVRGSQVWKLLWKEGVVSFMNGVSIGIFCGVSVYFWSSNAGIAMVISLAMVVAMVAAGVSGAAIPLILHSIGQDPAQSSSIILTTITDVVGFFAFLGLATLFMSMIV